MLNKIQIREIIAWTTLAIAFILFSATIAFAQTRSISVNNDDGKVHIKITKTDKGKTVQIDTTFDATDDMDLEKIVNDLSGDNNYKHHQYSNNTNRTHVYSNSGSGKNRKKIVMKMDIPEMTDAEKEKLHKELKESMKDLKENLEEMKESLQGLHIEFDDFDDKDFHFNFDMDTDAFKNFKGNKYAYSYSFDSDDEIDSLDDDNHVIIMGTDDENPPVLEKTIKSKNGNKVFIYKRSANSEKGKTSKISGEENNKVGIPGLHELLYFPNPTDGKFTIKFDYEKKGDITVKVMDNNSKEIFSDKLKNFTGEYSKEIDLSGKSKGNYIVKIIAGDKSITKKIVLN